MACLQISETSVNDELSDFQRAQTGSHLHEGIAHVSTRRIGAVGTSSAEQDAALAFNSTTVPTWCPASMPLLAITCSTNEPLYRILQWIRYHQLIGFSLFYFFVEGKATEPEVVDALRSLVGVKVCSFEPCVGWSLFEGIAKGFAIESCSCEGFHSGSKAACCQFAEQLYRTEAVMCSASDGQAAPCRCLCKMTSLSGGMYEIARDMNTGFASSLGSRAMESCL